MRRRLVLETLGGEHVAPVAGGITDAEVDGFALLERPREGLLAPRIPVDRILRMLAQIRAGLAAQPVGIFRRAVRVQVSDIHAAGEYPYRQFCILPAAEPAHQAALSSPSSIPRADTGSARELRLKRGEERRLSSGHLWVFSNEIDSDATPLAAFTPGDVAQIKSHRGQFLGHAYVNPHALICARILSRDPDHPIDRALLDTRLRAALRLRERLYRDPYYRLVFGESDGLPGLVLDRYGDVVVGRIATAGMELK